jgi:hypothetical protein
MMTPSDQLGALSLQRGRYVTNSARFLCSKRLGSKSASLFCDVIAQPGVQGWTGRIARVGAKPHLTASFCKTAAVSSTNSRMPS